MNALIGRGGLFDEFFKDMNPGFYVRPLHGDPLPTPAQIRIDVKESAQAYTVQAELPGVAKQDIHVSLDGNVVRLRAEIVQKDEQTSDDQMRGKPRPSEAVAKHSCGAPYGSPDVDAIAGMGQQLQESVRKTIYDFMQTSGDWVPAGS